ncbi:MAG: sigma-70 family RNA polymerase sigma factor [Syntrophaceae bacterium]|nr:sigma-70 family RNA polymerase sigma factor [Syntrophaceae bacterium]
MDLEQIDSEADRQDIAGSLAGDGEAYARLVRRYQDRMAAQMWRFTRDPIVLEQLVQDIFVEAFVSLKGFRGRAPFLHWLRRVGTRVGYRYWKSRALDREQGEALTQAALNRAAVPEDMTPSEAAELLHRLFEKLPPPDRLVLTLFYFEDCDLGEISVRAGWTRTLVKVRLHRARKRLKALLNKAGIGRT